MKKKMKIRKSTFIHNSSKVSSLKIKQQQQQQDQEHNSIINNISNTTYDREGGKTQPEIPIY